MSTDTFQPKEQDILDELAAVLVASLVEDSGVASDAARAIADKQIDRVRGELGGRKTYIPVRKFAQVEVVRQEIGRRWNGRNTVELCREFGITETWLRELYDQAHGKFIERRAARA